MSRSAGGPIFCQSDLNLNLRKLQRLKTFTTCSDEAQIILSLFLSLSAFSCSSLFPSFFFSFSSCLSTFAGSLTLSYYYFTLNSPQLLFCLVCSLFFPSLAFSLLKSFYRNSNLSKYERPGSFLPPEVKIRYDIFL